MTDRERRWRLVLGGGEADGLGVPLDQRDLGMDRALQALYDSDRSGGLGSSAPSVARWLGDIRSYFPGSVVQVLQKDAIDRLGLLQMLTEPELLNSVEPDVHLVADLVALGRLLPDKARETARQVVRKVVDDLTRRLSHPMRQAVRGSLNRAVRNRHPRQGEVDWLGTIRRNLKHYQPEYRTVIPVDRVGFGRKRAKMQSLILCVDQSGSMATSVVYSGVLGAVLASLPALSVRMVVFDTSVVDLTEHLHDPVELLFGTRLGGGTDIRRALTYSQGLVEKPTDTILVLISDLFEGGSAPELLKRMASLLASGVRVIALLALNDDGAPSYDHGMAAELAALGVPAFACTPDLFPDLMANALRRGDVGEWAARHGIVTSRGDAS